MKSKFSSIVFAVICGMFIASCGGGSGSSGKKLASNDVLGDLPNLVYQKHLTDSVIRVEEKAAFEKLDWKKKSDWEKGEKLKQKFRAKFDEADKKFEAEVEKLKAKLVGKDVPFEVEEGVGYKVNSFKIIGVNGGSVNAEFEIEVTDVKAAKFGYQSKYVASTPELWVSTYEIDKDGNNMGSEWGYAYTIKLSEKAEGAKGTATCSISASKRYVDFAKIKFVKSK